MQVDYQEKILVRKLLIYVWIQLISQEKNTLTGIFSCWSMCSYIHM